MTSDCTQPTTILIAAGGTGGHLYPTIAVADEIRRLDATARVVFVGTKRIESREVPRAGYPFVLLNTVAPGSSIVSRLRYPFLLAMAVLRAMRIVAKVKPSAVLSGGAYLSVPVGIAAWILHVPVVLLEINSVAGSANRLLARFAGKLFVAYPESIANFKKSIRESTEVVGTPVRPTLGAEQRSSQLAREHFGLDPNRQTVLIFGGSLGAKALNEATADIASNLAEHGYNVLWQTGKGNATEALLAKFQNMPSVEIREYIFEMEQAYAAADLVVCRAGASSLAELSRLRKPAILVPYPFAAANHQEANAQAFAKSGAARVLHDSELASELLGTVLELMASDEARAAMSKAMASRDYPEAAEQVASYLLGV